MGGEDVHRDLKKEVLHEQRKERGERRLYRKYTKGKKRGRNGSKKLRKKSV